MSDNEQMTREGVFDELARRGVHRVEVEFHGGSDEGDVERIALYTEGAEEPMATLDAYGGDSTASDSLLSDALQRPVWDRYRGFAGDFDVMGSVVWMVADRCVVLDASERDEYHQVQDVL